MTQYYRIQPDLDKYSPFKLDTYDFLDKLGEELELSDFGKPIKHAWQPIKGSFIPRTFRGTTTQNPDITTWQTDLLVFNQRAYDELHESLEPLGEFLPIEVESDNYYLFNMLTRLADEVIDTEKSEYEYYEEEAVGFRVLKFVEKKIPKDTLIFCVQNNFAYNVYCDDKFKNIINKKGLGGLYFNTTLIDPYFK